MRGFKFRPPSPSLIVSVIAVIAALAGTALAGGVLNKKKVNHIISNRAPGLSVGDSAKLGGQGPGSYQRRVRWAIVDSSGNITAQSGGIVNDFHKAAPTAGCPCDFLNFGSSQVAKAIIVTPSTGDRMPDAQLCGGLSNPGGVDCPATPALDDTNHIVVEFRDHTGASVTAAYYLAVIG